MNRIILYILFLSIGLPVSAQVEMKIVLDHKKVKVGQEIPILIVANSENAFQMKMPAFNTDKLDVLGYQTNTRSSTDPNGNKNTETEFLVVVRPKVAGVLKIGSFLAGQGENIYKTEPFYLEASKSAQRENQYFSPHSNNVALQIRLNEKNIFLHQATLLIVRAHSQNMNSLGNVRDVEVQPTYGATYHNVSANGTEIETKDNEYSVIIAEYLVFAEKPGRLVIPPVSAKVTQGGTVEKIHSNKAVLNVQSLPEDAPKTFENAVGDFNAHLSLKENGDLEINKPISVLLKISGKGNFKDLALPTFKKDSGFKVFKPKVSYHISRAKEGFQGDVTAEYVVIPEKAGTHQLALENFSYFNPKDKRYKLAEVPSINIFVQDKENTNKINSTLNNISKKASQILELSDRKSEKVSISEIEEEHNLPLWSYLVFVLLAGGVLYLFYRNKKARKLAAKEGEEYMTAAETTNVSEKETEIRVSQDFEINTYLDYLATLINEEKFDKFFEVFEELNKELGDFVQTKHSVKLSEYIENNFGSASLDQYRAIQGKAQVLKYSPFKDHQLVQDFYQEISSYFKVWKV